VTHLAVNFRLNIPTLFQGLTDFLLSQFFLLRPIILCIFWLPVLSDERGRVYVIRFPIQIEDFSLGSQKILGVPMALKAPGHAMRFGMIDHWHLIDWSMAAEATDAAIYVGGVVVINVIRRPVELDPFDRLSTLPTRPDWLEFRILLLDLGMTSHAGLSIGQIRMSGDVNKAVAITTVHPKL